MRFGNRIREATVSFFWCTRDAIRSTLIRIFEVPSPPANEFVNWCNRSLAFRTDEDLVLSDFVKGTGTKQHDNSHQEWFGSQHRRFFNVLHERLYDRISLAVTIDLPIKGEIPEISGADIEPTQYITKLSITHGSEDDFHFRNLLLGSVKVEDPEGQGSVSFWACDIAYLKIGNFKSVVLLDCNIGCIDLLDASIGELVMLDGCVLRINCRPPWENSPFRGVVDMRNVFLPRNSEQYMMLDPQQYRNLRGHLKKLENSQAAHAIHSAELAMERGVDPPFNQILSHLYEAFSDFGSSTLRPLIWLLGLFLFSTVLIYLCDGAIPALPRSEYVGWRANLLEGDPDWARLWRAMTLSFQNIGNPLSILGAKTLVVANNGWLVAWSSLQSIFSVTLIAMFILAVRRRFKMR